MLIRYKVDEKGMLWGAAVYSTEVSTYENDLEKRFKIPHADEEQLPKELSQRHREKILEGLSYLAVGLAIFGGFVWAIGWVVRGFLGIPRGMDKRSDKP